MGAVTVRRLERANFESMFLNAIEGGRLILFLVFRSYLYSQAADPLKGEFVVVESRFKRRR